MIKKGGTYKDDVEREKAYKNRMQEAQRTQTAKKNQSVEQ